MARNIYNILRLGTQIKSRRLKLLGIWLFHVLGKRYIGVFLDPVLACNFRCKMCYFSDEEKRKSLRGTLKYEEIEAIAGSLFHRVLKLQIGCGAEPTLHKDLVKIIALGKRYNVPYVSLTTNGNLMTNGKFDLFRRLLADVAEIKKQHPQFKLRINYTINNDNLEELNRIWEVVGDELDILQLRPIQKIGESEYQDFDLTNIYARYDAILVPLIEECRRKHIICLAPDKQNIIVLEENDADDNSIEKITYCYVSPQECWQDEFDYRTETFESYAAAHHMGRKLLWKVFGRKARRKADVTRKMNYNIK
ncbi:radical SAM protein [Parabacteroides merdae]|jgi:MoaA/NifB/PqqE/SkfB family radical SAM enzyme|uniref:radical SAM protein n=1 Tax=Parabacteroides merdae TaxID=46503 RepID=UPI001BA74126|nr:radical SAM protein [Parabacteroides merdae]QUT47642.1 Radical SAM superfamily protein [Parabacteroides merdae]